LKCTGNVHVSNLRRIPLCVKYIITLIWTSLKFSRPLRQAQGRLCGTEFGTRVFSAACRSRAVIQSNESRDP
jgi:hypothetical protein